MVRRLLASATFALLAACTSPGSSPDPASAPAGSDTARSGPLSIEQGSVVATDLLRSQSSGVDSQRLVAVTNASDWATLWAAHAANTGAAMPVVDFGRSMVVGVFAGMRADGCHHIRITGVSRAADHRLVRYHHVVPGAGVVCTQALVQPVHLVTVETSTLPTLFARDPDVATN